MKPLVIAVGESKPKKWKPFAKLIMLVEGTDHSHSFVSWKDHMGLRWVAEARGGGVQALSNVEFKQTNEVVRVYYYEVSPENFERAIRYIWEKLPTKYSPLQVVGLFWMRVHNGVVRSFGGTKRIGNPFRDGEFGQVCCEFAVRTVSFITGKMPRCNIDSMGMIETRAFNEEHGTRAPQEIVDRINGR